MWTGQRVQEKKNHRTARNETCALVCSFCSLCRELIPHDSSGRFVGVCRAIWARSDMPREGLTEGVFVMQVKLRLHLPQKSQRPAKPTALLRGFQALVKWCHFERR